MQLGEFCRSVQSHKDLGWVTSIAQDELQFLETGFHSDLNDGSGAGLANLNLWLWQLDS